MATEKFANNASTTLNGSIIAGATSLTVTSAAGFPGSGQFRILIDNEIIIVGAVSGTTFSSLSRGAETTTDAAHSNGATVTCILTAGAMANIPGANITSPIGGSYGGGLVLLESHTASASATLDFTSRNAAGQSGDTFQSDFNVYRLEFVGLLASADSGLHMQLSGNGGSTWISAAAYDRAQSYTGSNNSGGNSGATAESSWNIEDQMESSLSDWPLSGNLEIYNPASSTINTSGIGQTGGLHSDFARYRFSSGFWHNGSVSGTAAHNAFRLFFSTTQTPGALTITSGTVYCFGVAKT